MLLALSVVPQLSAAEAVNPWIYHHTPPAAAEGMRPWANHPRQRPQQAPMYPERPYYSVPPSYYGYGGPSYMGMYPSYQPDLFYQGLMPLGTPGFGVPGYGVPGYSSPGYGSPAYGLPGYGMPHGYW